MTPGTEFPIPQHSAMGTMLGFHPSVVSSPPAAAAAAPAADTRTYVHPSPGGKDIVLTPSASVVFPPTQTPDGPYSFRKEADNVVNMNQGFHTMYVYTDVVESRIVGNSLAPLLRCFPFRGVNGATIYERFTNVHYVPLLYKHFKSIEINIRDDTGRRVSFEYGRVTMTLLFRLDCSEDELQRLLRAP